MKKCLLSAAALAIVAGVTSFLANAGLLTGAAHAQNQPPAAAPLPHKIGLIDMGYVFKNYKKFEALREELKSEIELADREAQAKAAQIKKLQDDLKNSPFKPGSPEYNRLEEEGTRLVAEFESFRRNSQRDFLAREARVYKTIYLEVSDTVALAARGYKMTLVLRFNRDKIQEAEDPKEILNSMNHQVVFYQPEDDITLAVVDYLNKRYDPSAGGSAPRSATGNPPTRR